MAGSKCHKFGKSHTNESDSKTFSKFILSLVTTVPFFVQENKSFEDVRRELEGKNPILELDPRLIDGTRSFSDIQKFPLEMMKSPPDDLPEEVDKTRREVWTTLHLHFTLKKLMIH